MVDPRSSAPPSQDQQYDSSQYDQTAYDQAGYQDPRYTPSEQTQYPDQPQQYQPPQQDEPLDQEYAQQQPQNYVPVQAPVAAESELDALMELRMQPEEVLLQWHAPSRPFKERNKQYYTTIGIIVLLISLILFFAGQFLPIAVVVAVGFLAYVLSSVPPEIILNQVTTHGLRSDDMMFFWEEVGRFWYTEKFGQRLLHFEVTRFPNQITMLVPDENIGKELDEFLPTILVNQQPPPTSFDKAANWLQEKIPLDTEA